jgi:hypothetical protein
MYFYFMKVKAIITGSTGMVGEGVLHECLLSPLVEQVLVINRRSCGVTHPKLKEILHNDFSDFSAIESSLQGYNAAFLCMGVTSLGASEELYTKITYKYTLALAKTLVKLNPETTVCYVSGAGTKQEGARNMWIRVKGRTERELQALGKNMYMFRPGYIRPKKGMKNTYKMYKALDWLMFPLLKLLAPRVACTLEEIGKAMIHCAARGYEKKVLEVRDIVKAAS